MGLTRLAFLAAVESGDTGVGTQRGGSVCGCSMRYAGNKGVVMTTRRRHYWKCQQCGLTYPVSHSHESRRCRMCPDMGCKSYVGYGASQEDAIANQKKRRDINKAWQWGSGMVTD